MKQCISFTILCLLTQTLAAQTDSWFSRGGTLTYNREKDELKFQDKAGQDNILANEILYGARFSYYVDTVARVLTVFGENFRSPAVGYFLELQASLIKYKIEDGKCTEFLNLKYEYSQCAFSPYKILITSAGQFQLRKEGNLLLDKSFQNLEAYEFTWSLCQLNLCN